MEMEGETTDHGGHHVNMQIQVGLFLFSLPVACMYACFPFHLRISGMRHEWKGNASTWRQIEPSWSASVLHCNAIVMNCFATRGVTRVVSHAQSKQQQGCWNPRERSSTSRFVRSRFHGDFGSDVTVLRSDARVFGYSPPIKRINYQAEINSKLNYESK